MNYKKLLQRIIGVGLVMCLTAGCAAQISATRPTITPPTSTPVLPSPTPPTILTTIPSASSATSIVSALTRILTIGDYQYRMECIGEGSPVVLLLGGRAAGWKPIQTEIANSTSTCVFDHMGSSPTPLTTEEIAKNMHTLLEDAGVTGPYVLVGFSVGGYIARLFTDLYPDEVAGIALLDSSHEDQNARFLAALPSETSDECQELKDYRAELQGPHVIPIGSEISLDFDASAAEVHSIGQNLSNLPLVVLTAGRSEWPDCFPPKVREQLDKVWLEMQDDLASISTNSAHLIAEESGHNFAEQPEMVIDAIQRVVHAVQTDGGVIAP
jgi:pimeloyl-ACP methyl ester carboxylesterase